MKRIIDFLACLSENNNREWFAANKAVYRECKTEFDAFVDSLIDGISEFDDSIRQLTSKDCTYRIYRDTRFSSNKLPYKVHMGAFIVPHGKKSGFSGYYFQVGPEDHGYDSGCMLAAGNYCFENRVLRLLREDIDLDGGEEFSATLALAPDFTLDRESDLKRVPAGFESDKPWSDWLRMRNFCLVKEPGVDYMLKPGLLDRVLKDFRNTKPFLDFINRAVGFSAENNE